VEHTIVTEQPDLTLDDIVSAMRKNRIRESRFALWRFFARHDITVKKPAGGGAAARRRWIREQGFHDPARLVFIDETAVSTNMVRANGRSPPRRALDRICPAGG
jgi:hypothetical protein